MSAHRNPYVGEGADGARRSAQIDREEAGTLAIDDPRHGALIESAIAWDEQADALEAYRCPRSTTEAFNFGEAGGAGGKPRLSRAALLEGCTHPLPDSLWRAYSRGYGEGEKRRRALDTACLAARLLDMNRNGNTKGAQMTLSGKIVRDLFPLRHRHDGAMRSLIRSSITLEKTRRDRRVQS